MPQYAIKRATGPVVLNGTIDDTAWADADVLSVDNYPWFVGGDKQATAARLLYDDRNLYVQFQCQDRHSSAYVTQLNGPVCRDSCVEFFASIDPAAGPDYFNWEINCCGQITLGYGPHRQNRRRILPEQAGQLHIMSPYPGPIKGESPDDKSWWIAAAMPWDILSEFCAKTIEPRPGVQWKGNVYRCGGKTDPQYACWNWVNTPQPDFHRPEFFAPIVFE